MNTEYLFTSDLGNDESITMEICLYERHEAPPLSITKSVNHRTTPENELVETYTWQDSSPPPNAVTDMSF